MIVLHQLQPARGKAYTHVAERERVLIQNMRNNGVKWSLIRKITGRGQGAIAACLKKPRVEPIGKRSVGQPKKITPAFTKALLKAMHALQVKADGETEVTASMVKERAGVPVCTKLVRLEVSKHGYVFRKFQGKLIFQERT